MTQRTNNKLPKALSLGEETLMQHLSLDERLLPPRGEWVREWVYRGLEGNRRWRFDFAVPEILLAVEVQGLTREGGRHQRIDQLGQEYRKLSEAQIDGWTVLLFTTKQVTSGEANELIARCIHGRPGPEVADQNPRRTHRAAGL